MKQPKDPKTGRFCPTNSEPLGKRIGIRLPASTENRVRQVAGKDLSDWVREAIEEKLARESQQDCA